MKTARVKNATSAIPAISAQTSQDSAATLGPPLFLARAEPRDREADRHSDRDGCEQAEIQRQSRGDQCNAAGCQGTPRHRTIEEERYQQCDQGEGAREFERPFRGNHRASKDADPRRKLPRAPHHERSTQEVPVLVPVPVVGPVTAREEREHPVHGDVGEQNAPRPRQMLEVRREDRAVDDVAKIHDESRRDHHPQRCFCDEERQYGELGRAREHEHAHRDGLRLCQTSAHHRDAGDDPRRHDADEEPGRGKSAFAERRDFFALHFQARRLGRSSLSQYHTQRLPTDSKTAIANQRNLDKLRKNTGRCQVFRFPRHGAFDGKAGSRKIYGNTPREEDPMSASAYTRIPIIILAALALAACPGKKEKKQEEGQHEDQNPSIYYVSASAGLDTNPGTQISKFKTITHAMSVATRSGSTVNVAPGIYDTPNNNEAFPIAVPAGVLLIGDETNKGGGSTPTSIVGGGLAPGFPATVLPGTGSTIAGFTITNNNSSFTDRRGLILRNSTVILRNNTVTGATHKVGVYVDTSTNHMITGNRIVDNGGSSMGSGLAFSKGGVRSKVENNVITGNGFGVEYDVAGGDLGGGSAGSAGGNVISCNTQNNLVSFAPI